LPLARLDTPSFESNRRNGSRLLARCALGCNALFIFANSYLILRFIFWLLTWATKTTWDKRNTQRKFPYIGTPAGYRPRSLCSLFALLTARQRKAIVLI
jgi:hypothetical protein